MKKRSDKNNTDATSATQKRGKRAWLPGFCRVVGVVLLVVVIGLCVPVTLPRIFGFEIYEVVSGSMDPAIPVGSVLYVKEVDLAGVAEGDVIAYQDVDEVVAHRVVHNRSTLGEFVTKGDANNTEDREPIKYDAVVGRVEQHIPYLGMFMALYSTVAGKIYLLLTAGIGFLLWLHADRLDEAK